MEQTLVSQPYRISRTELARTGAVQYIRTFWFLLIGIPITGICLFVFIHTRLGLAAGTVCLLWPISIPGRILIVSWRKTGVLQGQTVAEVSTHEMVIKSFDGSKGTRIPRHWLRKFWTFGDLYVLEGGRFQFVLVRRSAFTPQQQASVTSILQEWVETRLKAPQEPNPESNSS